MTTTSNVSPPTPVPIEAPTITGWPQVLTIPRLAVATLIVGVCAVNPDGSVEPPSDIHATCITGRSDLDPSGVGTTTVTGHTTRAASTGALEQIGQLTVGDTFTIASRTWRVVEVGTWPATELPDRLFMKGGPRRIVLGTCHLTPAVVAGAPYTDTDLVVAVPA